MIRLRANRRYLPHLLCIGLHVPEQQSLPFEHELPFSKQPAIRVSGVCLVVEATGRGGTEPSAITGPALWNAKTHKANAVVSHRNLTFMTILPETLICGNCSLSNYSHCMQSFRRSLRKSLVGKRLYSGNQSLAFVPGRHTCSLDCFWLYPRHSSRRPV
jgi:hypothetical protein